MKIKLVGWFIEIVELKKYGVILGEVLRSLRFIMQEFIFLIISMCFYRRKSGVCFQDVL